MTNLDDSTTFEKLDEGNMRGQLHGLPEQCQTAWQKALSFKLPEHFNAVDKVIILGMGGSAIGGDLVRSLTFFMQKPVIFVNREYDLPAFTDENTLVIASSYSGNTEETLSAFRQSLQTSSKKIAITTGGKLKEISEAAGIPVFIVDHVSAPRAALGYSFIPLIALLRNLGFLEGIQIDVPTMIQSLKNLLEHFKETCDCNANPAKQLAIKLNGKVSVIYGAGILGEVARRWKTQINENSKAWAFYELFPELNHNATVGYQFPSALAQQIFVIFLHCPLLHPRTQIRFKITGELLAQNGIGYENVNSQGGDALSQMMSLIYLGDWVSFYLAMLYQIDPTPVKTIDFLKKQLNEMK